MLDVVPVNVQPQTSNSLGIYPKLPEVSTFANRPISLQASIKFSTSSNSKHHNSKINAAPLLPKFTSHYTKGIIFVKAYKILIVQLQICHGLIGYEQCLEL